MAKGCPEFWKMLTYPPVGTQAPTTGWTPVPVSCGCAPHRLRLYRWRDNRRRGGGTGGAGGAGGAGGGGGGY